MTGLFLNDVLKLVATAKSRRSVFGTALGALLAPIGESSAQAKTANPQIQKKKPKKKKSNTCKRPRRRCRKKCVNVKNNRRNCGRCGRVCPKTSPGCKAGKCLPAPKAPFTLVGRWDLVNDHNDLPWSSACLAVDTDSNIFVAGDGVRKYAKSGELLTAWIDTGEVTEDEPWSLSYSFPSFITVNQNGQVYATDWINNRVMMFSNALQRNGEWGSRGGGLGRFSRPAGITVDSKGSVYVADTGNHRVQKFTSEGELVLSWGEFGVERNRFYFPGAIAVDANGTVYVADRAANRIQRFSDSGTFIGQISRAGSESDHVYANYDLAVDNHSKMYLSDTRGRLLVFSTNTGSQLLTWNVQGRFTVDAHGNLYVLDSYETQDFDQARLSIYSPTK